MSTEGFHQPEVSPCTEVLEIIPRMQYIARFSHVLWWNVGNRVDKFYNTDKTMMSSHMKVVWDDMSQSRGINNVIFARSSPLRKQSDRLRSKQKKTLLQQGKLSRFQLPHKWSLKISHHGHEKVKCLGASLPKALPLSGLPTSSVQGTSTG